MEPLDEYREAHLEALARAAARALELWDEKWAPELEALRRAAVAERRSGEAVAECEQAIALELFYEK